MKKEITKEELAEMAEKYVSRKIEEYENHGLQVFNYQINYLGFGFQDGFREAFNEGERKLEIMKEYLLAGCSIDHAYNRAQMGISLEQAQEINKNGHVL